MKELNYSCGKQHRHSQDKADNDENCDSDGPTAVIEDWAKQ